LVPALGEHVRVKELHGIASAARALRSCFHRLFLFSDVRELCMHPFLVELSASYLVGSGVLISSRGNNARDNGFVFAVTDRINRATALFAGGKLSISIH
jgi:hypothetical protein